MHGRKRKDHEYLGTFIKFECLSADDLYRLHNLQRPEKVEEKLRITETLLRMTPDDN